MKHTERTVTELASLFRMLQVIPDADNVGRIYQMLLAFCTTWRTIGFRRGILMLVHPRDGEIRGHIAAEQDSGENSAEESTGLSFESLAKDVFRTFELIESSDFTLKARTFSVPTDWHRSAIVKAVLSGYPVLAEGRMSEFSTDPYFSFFGARCYIALPIKIEGRVVAVLAADNGDSEDEISVDDVSLAYSLSQQAGLAAERLLESLDNKRKFRVLGKLQDILRSATTTAELGEAINLSLSMICRGVGGSGCLVKDRVRRKTTHIKAVDEMTLDADDGDIAMSESFETILDRCEGGNKPIRGDAQYPLLTERTAQEMAWFHAFPLRVVDDCLGAMVVYVERNEENKKTKRFSARDRIFLDLASGIIATRLHALRENERIDRAELIVDELRSHLSRERDAVRIGGRAIDNYGEIMQRLQALRSVVFSRIPYEKRIAQIKEMLRDTESEARAAADVLAQASSSLRMIDFFGIVREVVDDIAPSISAKNVEVTVRIPDGGPELLMERESLVTALLNILRTVGENVSGDDRVMVECSTSSNRAHVCIADTGRGLPGDLLSRLFMPFSATEDDTKGSLSVAGSIIQRHGGEISLKSSSSWRTVLVVSFPVAANKDRRRHSERRRRPADRRTLAGQKS